MGGTQAIRRYKPEQETLATYTRELTTLSGFPFINVSCLITECGWDEMVGVPQLSLSRACQGGLA